MRREEQQNKREGLFHRIDEAKAAQSSTKLIKFPLIGQQLFFHFIFLFFFLIETTSKEFSRPYFHVLPIKRSAAGVK